MTHFLMEFPELDASVHAKIVDYVKKDQNELEDSLLYEVASESKIYDQDRRNSKFKLFTQPSLFQLVQVLVDKISKLNTVYNFTLVRNDLTYIQYTTGGFFKKHSDYLSLKSNIIQEFTMIICLDANCVGGETVFHINDYCKHASKSSVTPGHTLVFRKDLTHEGSPVIEGRKQILTANLWATMKDSKALLITFPEPETRTYTIPVNKILELPDTMLAGLVRFDEKPVYTHHAECSYDQFSLIYRIYMGEYLNTTEYLNTLDLLNFYA